MIFFSKSSVGKERKSHFLFRLWGQRPTHRKKKAEIGVFESNDQEENPSAFDVDTGGQLETGLSDLKAIGGALPCGVLRHLFNKPEWSALDGLNEYDEDYTSFTPRGVILTQDMIRGYLRAANQIIDETEKNAPRFSVNGTACKGSEDESEDDLRIL